MLQRIRDEAHRFGITHHRNRRSKAQIESALREIKGVGEKTEQRLILHYGSVARIAAAPVEDLGTLVGKELAERISAYLNSHRDIGAGQDEISGAVQTTKLELHHEEKTGQDPFSL